MFHEQAFIWDSKHELQATFQGIWLQKRIRIAIWEGEQSSEIKSRFIGTEQSLAHIRIIFGSTIQYNARKLHVVRQMVEIDVFIPARLEQFAWEIRNCY